MKSENSVPSNCANYSPKFSKGVNFSEGWKWDCYPDYSGCMHSSAGKYYFEYDCPQTKCGILMKTGFAPFRTDRRLCGCYTPTFCLEPDVVVEGIDSFTLFLKEEENEEGTIRLWIRCIYDV